MRVQIRTPRRQRHRFDADRLQDPIECGAELRIAVVQQIPTPLQEPDVRQSHVACHLRHPAGVGRGCDPRNPHVPGRHSHERQHVVRHQTCGGPHLGRKEIHRGQHLRVRTDEIPPRHSLPPFRRWRQAVPLQHIGCRLVANFVPQIAQSANDPPVSPAPILAGELEHQILDRLTPGRTARRRAVL